MLLPFLSAFFTATFLPHLLSANPPFADHAKHRHDKVVVCVSGGKDSVVALLAALAIYGRERVVAHHCLVEEDWEGTVEYIQGLCAALGVPLSISQARYYGYECLDCSHRYLRQAEIQVCTKCKSTNGRLVKIVSNLLDLVEWRLSSYPWFCRCEEAWFCSGLSVREKPDQCVFGFLGRE